MQRPLPEMQTPDVVSMSGVRFRWRGPRAFSLAIDSFALRAKERVLLIGPSGAGKSTFLSLLCGIVTPSEGRLEVLGTDMAKLSSSARDRFRAEHFGIIFQMFNLLPYGSVLDNVLLPLSFAPKRRRRASQGGTIESEASRLLASLGLDPKEVEGLSTANLSVGQQQRVAAARALIGAPRADRRRRTNVRARPQPAAGLPRSALCRRCRRRGIPHHGQPRGGAW